MNVGKVIGWKEGETPSVPEGLTITAYATELVNPRTVHTLPNGDVLVVQSRAPEGKPKYRPKDYIRGWIMSVAAGGGSGPAPESNLITLLRDTNRDGVVDERHDLLTGVAFALRGGLDRRHALCRDGRWGCRLSLRTRRDVDHC